HGALHLAVGHARALRLAAATARLALLGAITGFDGVTHNGRTLVFFFLSGLLFLPLAALLQLLGDPFGFLGGAPGGLFLGFLALLGFLLAASFLGFALLALLGLALLALL